MQTKISSISLLDEVTALSAGDLFVVSEPNEYAPDGLYTLTGYVSKKLSFGKYAFSGKKAANDPLLTIINDSNLKSIQTVDEDAFENNISLTDVTLTAATEIRKNAFNACTLLTNVKVDNIKTFAKNCFYGCAKIAKVEVGADLNHIENSTFTAAKDCVFDFSKLTTVPTLDNINAFPSPKSSKYKWKILLKDEDTYKLFIQANNWSKFYTKSYDRFEYAGHKAFVMNGKTKIEL